MVTCARRKLGILEAQLTWTLAQLTRAKDSPKALREVNQRSRHGSQYEVGRHVMICSLHVLLPTQEFALLRVLMSASFLAQPSPKSSLVCQPTSR